MYAMANLKVSILLSLFSYGNVGTWSLSSSKAALMLEALKREEDVVEEEEVDGLD